jgi:hypothetical protein
VRPCLRARAREEGLANHAGLVNIQTDAHLPEGGVDLVFVCDTYHHFERPREMLALLDRARHPGGMLVRSWTSRAPRGAVRPGSSRL